MRIPEENLESDANVGEPPLKPEKISDILRTGTGTESYLTGSGVSRK
jgi:hypothetical protein